MLFSGCPACLAATKVMVALPAFPAHALMLVLSTLSTRHLDPAARAADMAPCANTQETTTDWEARACPFPHPRLVDGAYVDNLATAQPLGQLQRRHPARTPLRAILVSSTTSPDPMRPIKDTNVANLFTDGGHNLAGGLSSPSAVIFAAKWKDITTRHLSSTTYVNVREVSTMTVENTAFGVAGGSPVDLLILSLDGPIPITIGFSTLHQDYELLATYGDQATFAEVQAVIQDWLART